MATVRIQRNMSASQERVFAALDDHADMGRWLGPTVTIVRSGAGGGVGTVRRIQTHLAAFEEEIVERSAPHRLAYRIIAGLPGLAHHRGDIKVSPGPSGGSSVDWQVELKMKIPGLGTLLGRAVKLSIAKGLARLDTQLS